MLISLFLVDHAAADIPFLALSPGLAIDKVQTQHTRTRAVPSASMLREGDAGSERPSPPRAPSLTTCLPTPISGVGTQRGWRAGGLGRVIALGGLRRAGAEKGIKLPSLGPPGVAPSLGWFGQRSHLLPPGGSGAEPAPGAARARWRVRGAGCRRAAPGQARKPGGARDPPARPGVWRAQGARGWGPSWALEAEIAGIGRRWWKEIAHREA